MTEERKITDWRIRAAGGYDRLGWVGNNGLLDHMIDLAEIKGDENVVDIGTGSLAVLKAFSKRVTSGQLVGFDMSKEMIASGQKTLPTNMYLFMADSLSIPVKNDFADVATARMVYHHIPSESLPTAVNEGNRILRPGGKIIVSEYIAGDEEIYEFERRVFDIKEPERNLWTGTELLNLIGSNWGPSETSNVSLSYAVLGQYSVRDWMSKSGLPVEKQEAILQMYIDAPASVKEKMNITIKDEQSIDALVDRPFAYVVAVK